MFFGSLYIFPENLILIHPEFCNLLIFEVSNQTLFPLHRTADAVRR